MNKIHIGALACCLVLTDLTQAALVWRPGEGWTNESSGESLAASDAKAALQLARNLEAKEDYKSALDAYRGIVRRWPLSTSAGEAQFKIGFMLEQRGEFGNAYKAYQKVVEKYPASQFFDLSIEREFAIGNLFLSGEPQRLWKIPLLPSMDKAVEVFNTVIKNAPYGVYAPQAYFKIGLAREKQRQWSDAIAAYNKLLDKYPGNDLAPAAQYQIGYAWYQASSQPDYDQSSAQKSIDAFQDFLTRFPRSEKADQARVYINELDSRRVQGAYNIALFYTKQKNYQAAIIYFNDVIQQGPNTALAAQAKAQIETIKNIQSGQSPGFKQPAAPGLTENSQATAAPPPAADRDRQPPVDANQGTPNHPPVL
ncbi:MAG: outer membrane protein assembly factor BamD [Verrucomicrobiales bacterium]|jgi:outer membrane protein assembly factor BamD|nr:outer membrane protein assembly factor BamD [Verrucomicrobiales bacterium]MDR1305381.1 outer membrane protein assembly factor BamD [Verrucomicrobiales bacterium]